YEQSHALVRPVVRPARLHVRIVAGNLSLEHQDQAIRTQLLAGCDQIRLIDQHRTARFPVEPKECPGAVNPWQLVYGFANSTYLVEAILRRRVGSLVLSGQLDRKPARTKLPILPRGPVSVEAAMVLRSLDAIHVVRTLQVEGHELIGNLADGLPV